MSQVLDIRELYENGDFDAIRKMLDAEEARAAEAARAARNKEIMAARVELINAAVNYAGVLGYDASEEDVKRLEKEFIEMERLAESASNFIKQVKVIEKPVKSTKEQTIAKHSDEELIGQWIEKFVRGV